MDSLDVVARFGDAWSAHDLEATIAMTTADCVFDATGPAPDGVRCEGHAAIRIAWEPIFADDRTMFHVEEVFGLGDRVIQLWRYDWSDGHIRGVDIFKVRDDLVCEKLSYVKG